LKSSKHYEVVGLNTKYDFKIKQEQCILTVYSYTFSISNGVDTKDPISKGPNTKDPSFKTPNTTKDPNYKTPKNKRPKIKTPNMTNDPSFTNS